MIIFRDLITLILSSVSSIQQSPPVFNQWINQLNTISSIPENTYSSILSAYAHYGKKKEAIEWMHRMRNSGIALRSNSFPSLTDRNRHVIPLMQLARETKDGDLLKTLNQFISSSSLDVNDQTRNETIRFCRQSRFLSFRCRERGRTRSHPIPSHHRANQRLHSRQWNY